MAGQDSVQTQAEAVVARYCEAIRAGDETAFLALWCGEGTDAVLSQSQRYQGPEGCAAFLAKLHELYSTITLMNDGMDAHLLTPDVAIVIFRYHTECVRAETGEPYGIAGLETQVLKLVDGAWKIAHIQYHGK